MNRREFMATVGASGMALIAPVSLSGKASAADLTPVGKYFVFAHLGGGWDPTTFCNPKGNEIRGNIDANSRNSGSPVNRFPASAIRRAIDVYTGSADIDTALTYAPYLGTYNEMSPDQQMDDGQANQGLTTTHIQQILSGSLVGTTLTAAASTGFTWLTTTAATTVRDNARAILERRVDTVELAGSGIVEDEIIDEDLALANGTQMNGNLFVFDAFVCIYADQLRVLNGIDNRTNSHSTGTTYADTGSMAQGYPDFSALYAAVNGPDRPLAWMTDGSGNNESAGIVARSTASNANVFNIIGDPTNGMTDGISTYLDRAQGLRKSMQAQAENLPLRRQFQDQLYLVREQGLEFADVAADIVTPPAGSAAKVVESAVRDGENRNRRDHMRIAASGFASGMASSMQVGFGGFDTHGDHDNQHFAHIRTVLEDLHFMFRALDAYGVQEQTTLIVGSDFGRTPWFNSGNGKDHWAVTSYMVMGNGIRGGTVVNATNALVEAKDVIVTGGNIVPQDNEALRMTAAHVHIALRKLAGIENHPYTLEFPIEAEDILLFG